METASLPPTVAAPAVIRNILFATDFSPCSELALPFAISLAKRHSASLFLVHVLRPEARHELPLEPEPEESNVARQEALRRFAELRKSTPFGEVVHSEILRRGEFWESMQEVAAEHGVDLIITGTHARGGFRKLLLGSTAEIIFRNAACPVMTIGPHVRPDILAAANRNVVFATDFSPASLHALPYALAMTLAENGCLTLLHAVAPPYGMTETVVMPAVESELMAESRARLRAIVAQQNSLVIPPEVSVVTARPAAEAIVFAARERNAAMIVLGVRHKRAFETRLPWSVADAVVAGAHCPVLTVRGD